MQLPLKLTDDQMQSRWKALLDPVLANTILQGQQINDIVLPKTTPVVINHKLGRQQLGWFIVDQDAAASVFRTADFNNLTLTLESSGAVTINIWVY